jgi:thiamine biosynthesis lipoprotein
LDLGAIAKGHALDLAAARLRELGVTCGLLHAGTSSILALEAPPGTPGWRIAIAAPPSESAGGELPGRCGVVTLRHAALGVSAPHGRTVTGPAGQAWGHVMDPRTGKPATTARLAAAVCRSAAAADAWSTALLVMGAAGIHVAPDEVWARLIVGESGEILSSVRSGGPGSPIAGTGTQVSWCTLEVGA